MAQNFWLIDFDDTRITVSLVFSENSVVSVAASGSPTNYTNQDTLVNAVDQSLSNAAARAGLSENSEPSLAAFIVPPHWIGADGKILSQELKLIESLCRSLKLQPMGFIAHDEAIVEGFTTSGDLPPSFILLRLGSSVFDLTLVYLGKIQKRLHQSYTGLFSSALFEKTLVDLNAPSTLPPQVIVFGDVPSETLLDLRNYPWVGRKDIETFLHFPDIRFLPVPEISEIFAKVVSSQLGSIAVEGSPPPPSARRIRRGGEDSPEPPSSLIEVLPEELGFSPPATLSPPPTPKPKLKLRLPPIKLSLPRLPLFLIAVTPTIVPLFFFLSSAKIILYLTPYEFKNEIAVILDSSITSLDRSKNLIPVLKKSFDVTATKTIPTTGEKTVGDKAKGEIVIFNKSDKIQGLKRGAILTDQNGKRFELVSDTQVASSSADLSQGIITLGQARTIVAATDIGPEYNLPRGSSLDFKDIPANILITQVKEALAGGSKRQIKAVGPGDKNRLEAQIVDALKSSTEANVAKNISSIPGVIKETISVKKNRIDYNREVGEEADELTATAQSTISVFAVDNSLKSQLIDLVLVGQPEFSLSEPNLDNFTLSFKIDKINTSQAPGKLIVTGHSLPKVDSDLIRRSLAGKSYQKAVSYLKTSIPRLYNFSLQTNYGPLQHFLPLPFRLGNIHLEFSTSQL